MTDLFLCMKGGRAESAGGGTGDLLDWLPRLSKKTSAPPPLHVGDSAYHIFHTINNMSIRCW